MSMVTQYAYEPAEPVQGWTLDGKMLRDTHGWPHGARRNGRIDYSFLVKAPLTLKACGYRLTVAKDQSIQLSRL